jgi:hypothetical protein
LEVLVVDYDGDGATVGQPNGEKSQPADIRRYALELLELDANELQSKTERL